MLVYSTMLQIKKSMTKDDFIRLVIDWNQGSPMEINIIHGIEWNGEYNVRYGNEDLWLEFLEDPRRNIIAARYEKRDQQGSVWDSDFVLNFDTMKLGIQLQRSFLAEAVSMSPVFSTPYLINLLIDRGWIEPDHGLPVTREPIWLSVDNMPLLAEVINGERPYQLPVVFLSKTFDGLDPADPHKTANRLKGVAHVFVMESASQNSVLKELCQGDNPYNGSVGIYYPNPTVPAVRWRTRQFPGSEEAMTEKLIRNVIQYWNAQAFDPLYTWNGVCNAMLSDQAERLLIDRLEAEKQSREAHSLLEAFDDDNLNLKKRIEELIQKNEALERENNWMQAQLSSLEAKPLLVCGQEKEIYPEELKDLVLSALSDALEGKPISPNTRRALVVEDVLSHNEFNHLGEQKKDELKSLLKGYKTMTPALRRALTDLGFVITAEGKHYKVAYDGDERWSVVFGKTVSDVRSGKNNAAMLADKSF